MILVPFKNPERAKQRLAAVLSPMQRAALVLAMFEDVRRAVDGSGVGAAVVTDCVQVQERARQSGWRVIPETAQVSESASVDRASRLLGAEGVQRLLRLPADLPRVTSADIAALLACRTEPPSALLVPSRDGSGTNALLRSPADLFPSRFGVDSLTLHLQEARRAGAAIRVLRNDRIAFDLDDPSDLQEFLREPSDTATWRVLCEMGMAAGD